MLSARASEAESGRYAAHAVAAPLGLSELVASHEASKKSETREYLRGIRAFLTNHKKYLFYKHFLNDIVGADNVEACCHASAGICANQSTGYGVDCHALCAFNNDFAVASHYVYVLSVDSLNS